MFRKIPFFLSFLMATVSIPSPRATFFLSKTSEWLKSLVIFTVVILPGPEFLNFLITVLHTQIITVLHMLASFKNHKTV